MVAAPAIFAVTLPLESTAAILELDEVHFTFTFLPLSTVSVAVLPHTMLTLVLSRLKTSSGFGVGFAEGLAEGLAEGTAEGLAEGLAEGVAVGLVVGVGVSLGIETVSVCSGSLRQVLVFEPSESNVAFLVTTHSPHS